MVTIEIRRDDNQLLKLTMPFGRAILKLIIEHDNGQELHADELALSDKQTLEWVADAPIITD